MVRGEDREGWCILRTSAAKTLPLVQSLADAGYEVWAPTETRVRLAGRDRKQVEQDVAMMPCYAFARIAHLADLLALSRSPALTYQVWDADLRRMVTKGHPFFSVFHEKGAVRPQSDASLAPLRALEAALAELAERRRDKARMKALQKGEPPKFTAGQIVRVDGGFNGLSVVVAETNRGKNVKLTHPDWMRPVEICAWKLADLQVETTTSSSTAALAA
ncbi:hypothetical protein [Sphingomonas immobilis]|uniref:NusG-like N-terminal domain-containing protein n=1 Tax=Sphingomonas immobilis TaxID=3063997 RepID=A0ABT8ZU56_9SPHN|nr:hypothetical protein [Sphingomonas sp. CA1-15]MDO7841094.1 hypothetical protein [Sphingomonas sp. CA1-15]